MKKIDTSKLLFDGTFNNPNKEYLYHLHQLILDHLLDDRTNLSRHTRRALLFQYKRPVYHTSSQVPGRYFARCHKKKSLNFIHLDPRFFDRNSDPEESRIKVLAHEMCHLAGYEHGNQPLLRTEKFFAWVPSNLHLPALVLFVFCICCNLAFGQTPNKQVDTLKYDTFLILRTDPSNNESAVRLLEDPSLTKDTIKMEDRYFNAIQKGTVGEREVERLNTFQLLIDQEAFLLRDELNEDRDYTMGLQVRWTGERTNSLWYFLIPGVHYLLDTIPNAIRTCRGKGQSEFKLINHAISFGFSAFTPEDLASTNIVTDDRPYASLLHFGTERLYTKRDNIHWSIKTNFSTGFFGGFTGTGIAKFTQTAIHSGQRATSDKPEEVRPDPQGWKYVISPNNSLFYQYDFKLYYNFLPKLQYYGNPNTFKVAANLYTGAGTGIYDYVALPSLSIVTGWTDLLFDEYLANHFFYKEGEDNQLPPDLIYRRNRPDCFNTGHWGVYFIGNVNPKLWIRNATLQGLWWNNNADPYHISADELQRLTVDYEFGAGLKMNKTHLGYTFNGRTAETTLVDRKHLWGRVFLKIIL